MSSCLSYEELEQALSVSQTEEELLAHLERCEKCRAARHQIRENNLLLSRLGQIDPQRLSQALTTSDGSPISTISIEGYEILSELHRGGQGVVYMARQLRAKRVVALKMPHHGAFATSRMRQRFEREIELVASLRHPNIVALHDSGVSSDGRLYFAMELIDGVQLDQHLRSLEPQTKAVTRGIPLAYTLRLFSQICDAVNYAHQRGIVHRDLKPGNILIDRSGEARVLDFGLARVSQPFAEAPGGPTIAGEFMGTLAYTSPEQVSGDPSLVDIRTDVYALGVILYEMLTDRLPISMNGGLAEITERIAREEPRSPTIYCRNVGSEIEAIVLKALAKEPKRRYQSAGLLAEDIRRYLAGEVIDAKRDSTWYVLCKATRRLKLPIAIASSMLLLVFLFAVAMSVQAGRLAKARNRASLGAMKLARELHVRNIERGRVLAFVGNTPAAENTLWREFLLPPTPASGDSSFVTPFTTGRTEAEWALWELYSQQPCRLTWNTFSRTVSACFSPDGRQLATLNSDGDVRVWRTADGMLLRTHVGSTGLRSLIFNSDATRIVAWSATEVRFWNLQTDEHTTFRGVPNERIHVLGFNDENYVRLLIASPRSVVLQSLGEGSPRTIYGDEEATIRDAWLSSDENMLAVLNANQILTLRSLSDERTIVQTITSDAPIKLVFNAKGNTVAVNEIYYQYWWMNLSTGGSNNMLGVHDLVTTSCFSPDGETLLIATRGRKIYRFNTATGARLTSFAGHAGEVKALCVSTDGRQLASGGADGTIRTWDAAPSLALRRFEGHTSTVFAVQVSPDGQSFATAGKDGGGHAVRLWNTADRSLVHAFHGHEDHVSSVDFSPDGSLLVSGSYDGTLALWSVSRRERVAVLIGHRSPINGVCFAPDGRTILSCDNSGAIRLWDVATRRCLKTVQTHSNRVPGIAISPNGKTLASCDQKAHRIVLWDVPEFAQSRPLESVRGIPRVVRFSPDNRWVASGGDDWVVRLWDAATGKHLRSFEKHQATVYALAFSASGRILASGSRDGEIRLWDTATGRTLATLYGNRQTVFGLAFAPDEKTLFATGENGFVGSWDLTYYRPHIAGNLAFQIAKLESNSELVPHREDFLAWAATFRPSH